MELTQTELERVFADVVGRALSEDLGSGDITSEELFSVADRCEAVILLKEAGIVCGLPVARAAFRKLDEAIEIERLVGEGEVVTEAPREIVHLAGRTRALLGAERVALNLLGRL